MRLTSRRIAAGRRALFALAVVLGSVDVRGQVPSGPVTTSASLSHASILRGDGVARLWINLTNTSGGPLEGLRIASVSPEHLRPRAASWCTPPASQPVFPGCAVVASTVPAGQSLVVWLDAVGVSADDFRPGVLLEWSGPVAGQHFVVFEPLQVLSPGGWLLRPDNPWWLLLSGIGGAIATLLVQNYQRKKTSRAETWKLMLPESHKNNMMSYVGLTTWSQHTTGVFRSFRQMDPAASQEEKDARARTMVFALVMVQWGMRQMRRNPGGLYLKNRLAEELIVHCESRYRELALHTWCETKGYVPDATELMSAVLDGVGEHESPARFWRKVRFGLTGTTPRQRQRSRDFQRGIGVLLTHVGAWVAAPETEPAMTWLTARYQLLVYEINRPYEEWYGSRESLSLDRAAEALLLADAQKGQDAAAYLQSVREGV